MKPQLSRRPLKRPVQSVARPRFEPAAASELAWCAHLAWIRINIALPIVGNQVEEMWEPAVLGRFIGVCASWQVCRDLRSVEVSGNRSTCQAWWARWWALGAAASREGEAPNTECTQSSGINAAYRNRRLYHQSVAVNTGSECHGNRPETIELIDGRAGEYHCTLSNGCSRITRGSGTTLWQARWRELRRRGELPGAD